MTHICVSKLTIIGSDNGLSPGRRQAIIWTNAGILLIGPLRTNFSEILIEIHTFSFKKMHLKMSLGKWQPSCLGLNVLKTSLDESRHPNSKYNCIVSWHLNSMNLSDSYRLSGSDHKMPIKEKWLLYFKLLYKLSQYTIYKFIIIITWRININIISYNFILIINFS